MRLFVAVRPPAEIVEAVAAALPTSAPGVEPIDPGRWILKLRPLGHVATRLVDPLVAALEESLDGAPARAVTLGSTERRWAGRALCVPVAGVDDLAEAVFEATERLVPVTHPQPYYAHLMVAAGRIPRGADGTAVVGGWTVSDVRLVADRSSPRGVRLEDLAVLELDPAAEVRDG
jgi:2'-5' RNA ligase